MSIGVTRGLESGDLVERWIVVDLSGEEELLPGLMGAGCFTLHLRLVVCCLDTLVWLEMVI